MKTKRYLIVEAKRYLIVEGRSMVGQKSKITEDALAKSRQFKDRIIIDTETGTWFDVEMNQWVAVTDY